MTRYQRTPKEWFAEAARCYLEYHQGCAWCGGCHRVFRTEQGSQLEYYCTGCDFRAAHDQATNRYFSYPGEHQVGDKPSTMTQT
jgi:hypothetical protein